MANILTITKSPATQIRNAGQEVTFNITVRNDGNFPANDFQFEENPTFNFTAFNITSTPEAPDICEDVLQDYVICDYVDTFTLNPQEELHIVATFTISPSTPPGTYQNDITVTYDYNGNNGVQALGSAEVIISATNVIIVGEINAERPTALFTARVPSILQIPEGAASVLLDLYGGGGGGGGDGGGGGGSGRRMNITLLRGTHYAPGDIIRINQIGTGGSGGIRGFFDISDGEDGTPTTAVLTRGNTVILTFTAEGGIGGKGTGGDGGNGTAGGGGSGSIGDGPGKGGQGEVSDGDDGTECIVAVQNPNGGRGGSTPGYNGGRGSIGFGCFAGGGGGGGGSGGFGGSNESGNDPVKGGNGAGIFGAGGGGGPFAREDALTRGGKGAQGSGLIVLSIFT